MKFTRGDVVWVPCKIAPSDAPGSARFILIVAETDNDWAGDVSASSLMPRILEKDVQYGTTKAKVIVIGVDDKNDQLQVGVIVAEDLIHSAWFWVPVSVVDACCE